MRFGPLCGERYLAMKDAISEFVAAHDDSTLGCSKIDGQPPSNFATP